MPPAALEAEAFCWGGFDCCFAKKQGLCRDTTSKMKIRPENRRVMLSCVTTFIFPIVILTTPTLYYLFFGTIEVACASLIVWYAWRWPRETVPRIEPSGQPLPLQQLSSPIPVTA